jgi:predicted DNA-binding protein YlxM (UPF0122 family)
MTDIKTDKLPIEYNRVDVGKALKLRIEKGLSYEEIANLQGVKKQSVYNALKKFKGLIEHPEEIQSYVDNKSKLLSAVELELIAKIADPKVINSADLSSLASSFQRLDNINRLEQGKSTANIVSYHQITQDIEEIRAEKAQLKEQLGDNYIDVTPESTIKGGMKNDESKGND